MVPLVFGINAGEFVILVALAVILFGPERIPEYSRKAARVIYYLRRVANDATHQLKDELGPEYQDLTLDDLNPKTFVQKHVIDGLQSDIDDVERELNEVKTDLDTAARGAAAATDELNKSVNSLASGTGQSPATPHETAASEKMRKRYGLCFDLDAT